MTDKNAELVVSCLGACRYPSPLHLSTKPGDQIADFVPDEARVLMNPLVGEAGPSFELAGPRPMNYFSGPEVTAGIVTCGGLCPGMNNVVRGLVLQLWHSYGVRRIYGFRYGFAGIGRSSPNPPILLTPEMVRAIHLQGGTILGSSRGPQPPEEMVGTLQHLGVNMLFCVGGDGTMRGALSLYEELARQNVPIAVVGVPKTIDNDLLHIERTFGFETAVSIAADSIRAAHVEAEGAPNGVGLVKLMGRHSGFIAASASMASPEVNLVLVPEQRFTLSGTQGIVSYLRQRLKRRGHAVIVTAEGAGQEHLPPSDQRDASGNPKLRDIGVFLRDTLQRELADLDIVLKYIDPSYIIRAAPANPADAIFCGRLAEEAVHSAMAGKTGVVMGLWLERFTHVPLTAVTAARKVLSLDSPIWRSVLRSTGQPDTWA